MFLLKVYFGGCGYVFYYLLYFLIDGVGSI